MNPNGTRNIAASVRQRLLNFARAQQEEFQGVLTRYALERLLYRLSKSKHSGRFTLKGAMLFTIWFNEPHRATRDLDLLCSGDNTVSHLEQVFREICCVQVEDDGLDFKKETVRGEQIKEDQEYQGVRIKLNAFLSGTLTRIGIQVDIGFGDAITPKAEEARFPTILKDFPAPHLQTYPPATVVAEKFQAMVALGIANSRMKDFYDLCYLAQKFSFQGEVFSLAIKATFDRRKTSLPKELPLALTPEFFEDSSKQAQWKAFLRKGKLRADKKTFNEVALLLKNFLMPPTLAAAHGQTFKKKWSSSGPWQ